MVNCTCLSLALALNILPATAQEKTYLTENAPEQELPVMKSDLGRASNPILPDFHADPEVLYSNLTKKYYIYSTTDGTPGWGGYDFNVFSCEADAKNPGKDLCNPASWKDEGKMLNVKDDHMACANGNSWSTCIIER